MVVATSEPIQGGAALGVGFKGVGAVLSPTGGTNTLAHEMGHIGGVGHTNPLPNADGDPPPPPESAGDDLMDSEGGGSTPSHKWCHGMVQLFGGTVEV